MARTAKRISRRAARKQALDILYEADLRGRPLDAVLAHHLDGEEPPGEFTLQLVRTVARHAAAIDDEIRARARDWRLERMPIVDRNLLRLGLAELHHLPDVPPGVSISEAVALAKELSTDDSGRFVNGLLARAADALTPPDDEHG